MAGFCGLEFVNRASHLQPGPRYNNAGRKMAEIRGFCTGVTGVCTLRARRPAAQTINHEGVGCWSLEFGSLVLFDINRGPRAFLHRARAHLGRILCLDP